MSDTKEPLYQAGYHDGWEDSKLHHESDAATFAALVEVARAANDLDNWDGWFKTELTQSVGDDEEAYENELVRRQDELSKKLHVLYALNPKLLEDGR